MQDKKSMIKLRNNSKYRIKEKKMNLKVMAYQLKKKK